MKHTRAEIDAEFHTWCDVIDQLMLDRLDAARDAGRISEGEHEIARGLIRDCEGSVNWRLKTKAGRAWAVVNVIQISGPILQDNGRAAVMNRTYPHEIAHVVAYQVHGKSGKGHGHLWRKWCSILQGIPQTKVERCHNFDVRTRTQKFVCEACDRKYPIGPVQAKRIKEDAASKYSYSTNCCGVTLEPKHLIYESTQQQRDISL